MLLINNDLVSQLLTMEDCIRVQEEAFKKLPTGGAIHRPRIDMYFPCERPDGYFRWGTMEGANDGYFAIRMKSDIMTLAAATRTATGPRRNTAASPAPIAASSFWSRRATASRSPSSTTACCSICGSAAAPASA